MKRQLRTGARCTKILAPGWNNLLLLVLISQEGAAFRKGTIEPELTRRPSGPNDDGVFFRPTNMLASTRAPIRENATWISREIELLWNAGSWRMCSYLLVLVLVPCWFLVPAGT